MYEFIRIQLLLGRIAPEQVATFVPRFITAEQAAELKKEVDNHNG